MIENDPITTALMELLGDEVAWITNYVMAATFQANDGTEHIVVKVPDGGSWATMIGLGNVINNGLQTVATMIGAPPTAGAVLMYGDEEDEDPTDGL